MSAEPVVSPRAGRGLNEALTRVFDVTSATRPHPHPRSRLLWRDPDFGPLPLPGP